MNQNLPNPDVEMSSEEIAAKVRSLLHKEGTWVEWGQTCKQLQQAGRLSASAIFEQTGFQASQQNQVIVASQVYESVAQAGADEAILNYCRGPRSDVLYEFRILNQEQRLAAATLAAQKNIEVDTAKEVARAMQQFARLAQLPSGFTDRPGDAVAYQCWKAARQKKDLQERSRLIAKGLKFAHSATARAKIEQLLSDFTVVPQKTAPLMPLYRLELEEELPRIVPFAGSFPLTAADLTPIKAIEASEPFRVVELSHTGSFIPIPGWQAILKATDPVAMLVRSDRLPQTLGGKPEEVLVVVDRALKAWNAESYFLVVRDGNLAIHWFEEQPDVEIIAQVVLLARPKKILDENNLLEPWQMDD